MRAGIEAFDFGRQMRQLHQQRRVVGALRAANLRRHGRQVALGVHQRRGDLAGDRQAEQRHQPVGLGVEDALDRPADPPRRQIAGLQHEARAAVGVKPQVGVQFGAAHHPRADQVLLQEVLAHQRSGVTVADGITADDNHMHADQPLTRKRAQPLLRHVTQRRPFERRDDMARRQPAPEGAGLELGVLLPAQVQATDVDAELVRVGCRHRQMLRAQQFTQGFPNARVAVEQPGQVRQRNRRFESVVRAGVDFVVQAFAQRMRPQRAEIAAGDGAGACNRARADAVRAFAMAVECAFVKRAVCGMRAHENSMVGAPGGVAHGCKPRECKACKAG